MTAPTAMAMSVADVMLACVALAASAAATVVLIAIVSELRKRNVTSTSRPTKRHMAAMQPSSAVAAGVDAARMENGPSNTMRVFVAAIAVTAVCTAGFTLIAQGGLGDTYKESLASLSEHAARVVEQASAPTERGGGNGSDVVAAPEFPSEITYSACADAEHREAGTLVGAYGNFGGWFRNITASHADSVQLFNQGLALCYGFNQEEAARNFRQCIELDGDVAAMCHWGLAYALGPIINKSNLTLTEYEEGKKAAGMAMAVASRNLEGAGESDTGMATVERDLIQAMLDRFPAQAQKNYFDAWTRYSDSMRTLARRYPVDWDVQALFAEALMTLTPWRYFEESGELTESGDRKMHETASEAYQILETIILSIPARSEAQQLLALHMMVHITEADIPAKSRSRRGASRGEEAADRLAVNAPGLCHLVHMSAHTFVRIGRYKDAVRVGLDAMACDASYVEKCFEAYGRGHNIGLMQYPAMMSWQSEVAIGHGLPLSALPEFSVLPTGFYPMPDVLLKVRFGRFGEVIADMASLKNANTEANSGPLLDGDDYSLMLYHYSLGIAHASADGGGGGTADLGAARYHLSLLQHHLDGIEEEDTETESIPGAAHVNFPVFSKNSPFWPARKALGNILDSILTAAIAVSAHNDSVMSSSLGASTEHLNSTTTDSAGPSPNLEVALETLRNAKRMYEKIPYFEPELFYLSVGPCLADLLFGLDELDEAMEVYEEDVMLHPGNGWSALGVERVGLAKDALGSFDDVAPGVSAAKLEARMTEWKQTADFVPPRACMEVPSIVRAATRDAHVARRD